MLRVEASNLGKSRTKPRPRLLLPNPSPRPRRIDATLRSELLPPATRDSVTTEYVPATRGVTRETWSVKLELGDDEIAKLYGQGMTRGAVVWKKGMEEWRPLLITPELSGLLHRTRIDITETPSFTPPPPPPRPFMASGDELTVPRPSPLPREFAPASERSPIPTFAPMALDVEVEAAPAKPRRRFELMAVAAAAFALAWVGHDKLQPASDSGSGASSSFAALAAAANAAAAPACEPSKVMTTTLTSKSPASNIPTVELSDLPFAKGKGKRGWVTETSAPASTPSPVVASRAIAAPAPAPASASEPEAAESSPSKSAPTPRPVKTPGRLTRTELVEALNQVARAGSSCGERGGPVRVMVTFANSGVARSIQVSGPSLPASTRSCLIGAASRARVPAFTGDPVTVSKSL